MTYPYSIENMLDEPQNYMYSDYGGFEFLQEYFDERSSRLNNLLSMYHRDGSPVEMELAATIVGNLSHFVDELSATDNKYWSVIVERNPVPNDRDIRALSPVKKYAESIDSFKVSKPVNTNDLLYAIVAKLALEDPDGLVKEWLDRIVQRFEVTKKLYESYAPGFRKGVGSNRTVQLYFLFALGLALYFASTRKIKYLNSLLKVMDLICSLPEYTLKEGIWPYLISLALLVEIISVKLTIIDVAGS